MAKPDTRTEAWNNCNQVMEDYVTWFEKGSRVGELAQRLSEERREFVHDFFAKKLATVCETFVASRVVDGQQKSSFGAYLKVSFDNYCSSLLRQLARGPKKVPLSTTNEPEARSSPGPAAVDARAFDDLIPTFMAAFCDAAREARGGNELECSIHDLLSDERYVGEKYFEGLSARQMAEDIQVRFNLERNQETVRYARLRVLKRITRQLKNWCLQSVDGKRAAHDRKLLAEVPLNEQQKARCRQEGWATVGDVRHASLHHPTDAGCIEDAFKRILAGPASHSWEIVGGLLEVFETFPQE